MSNYHREQTVRTQKIQEGLQYLEDNFGASDVAVKDQCEKHIDYALQNIGHLVHGSVASYQAVFGILAKLDNYCHKTSEDYKSKKQHKSERLRIKTQKLIDRATDDLFEDPLDFVKAILPLSAGTESKTRSIVHEMASLQYTPILENYRANETESIKKSRGLFDISLLALSQNVDSPKNDFNTMLKESADVLIKQDNVDFNKTLSRHFLQLKNTDRDLEHDLINMLNRSNRMWFEQELAASARYKRSNETKDIAEDFAVECINQIGRNYRRILNFNGLKHSKSKVLGLYTNLITMVPSGSKMEDALVQELLDFSGNMLFQANTGKTREDALENQKRACNEIIGALSHIKSDKISHKKSRIDRDNRNLIGKRVDVLIRFNDFLSEAGELYYTDDLRDGVECVKAINEVSKEFLDQKNAIGEDLLMCLRENMKPLGKAKGAILLADKKADKKLSKSQVQVLDEFDNMKAALSNSFNVPKISGTLERKL